MLDTNPSMDTGCHPEPYHTSNSPLPRAKVSSVDGKFEHGVAYVTLE